MWQLWLHCLQRWRGRTYSFVQKCSCIVHVQVIASTLEFGGRLGCQVRYFSFLNLCAAGRQGEAQEHHLLHPQLQLRGQFCLSCCTLISCFAMQLDNTSVPLKMLCNMERTFQACMPQMLGIPKHSILNQVAVANCVTSYWGNGYRAQRGEV